MPEDQHQCPEHSGLVEMVRGVHARLDRQEPKIDKMAEQVASLRASASIWGAITGLVASILISVGLKQA